MASIYATYLERARSASDERRFGGRRRVWHLNNDIFSDLKSLSCSAAPDARIVKYAYSSCDASIASWVPFERPIFDQKPSVFTITHIYYIFIGNWMDWSAVPLSGGTTEPLRYFGFIHFHCRLSYA